MKKLLVLLLLICSTCSAQTGPDWLDIENKPIVDVKQFRAKGDGTTDDRAAIQAAIDHCLLYNKELYISPPTTFYAIKSIHPSYASDTGLLIYSATSADKTLSIRGASKDRGNNTTLQIRGAFPGAVDALITNVQSSVVVKDLGFGSDDVGAIWYDATSAPGKNFTNVSFSAITEDGADYGLYLNAPYASTLQNCNFSKSKTGLYIKKPATSISLIGCYANDNSVAGFYLYGTTYSSLVSCASDFQTKAYFFDDCVSTSLVSCGAEHATNAVYSKASDLDVFSFHATLVGTDGITASPSAVFQTETAQDGRLIKINSLYNNPTASQSYVFGGAPRYDIRDINYDRSDVEWGNAYAATERFSTLASEKFHRVIPKTAAGTTLTIPIIGLSGGSYLTKLSISGLSADAASGSTKIVDVGFRGDIVFSSYTRVNAIKLFGYYGIATSTETISGGGESALNIDLDKAYDSIDLRMEYQSETNRPVLNLNGVTLN